MYSVIDDAVKIGFVVVATVLSWWFMFDSDDTVGVVEID